MGMSVNLNVIENWAGLACDVATGLCGPGGTSTARVTVTYVTDPICSACWVMEPAWRAVNYHLGDLVEVRHVYGGLLPDWDGFADTANGIGHYSDVAAHWVELAEHTGQALNASVWDRDPIASSYPPSLVLAAVRDAAADREGTFLRRLREELFVHGRNIARPEVWQRAVEQAGLDSAEVHTRLADGRAAAGFGEDLAAVRALRVSGFPTLIVEGPDHRVVLRGFQSFGRLASVISEAGGVPFDPKPVSLDEAICHLDVGTTAEYATLLGRASAEVEHALAGAGIGSITLPGGKVWIP